MRKAVNAVNVVNSVQITIYPRRSEPFIGNQKQLFGFVFSVFCSKSFAGLTEYFDRCTEILNCVRQRHIASWSMLCCCVMKYSQWIVLLLSLSKVVCFDPPCSRTYVLHVWDKNWTIGNIQPGHQGLQLKVGGSWSNSFMIKIRRYSLLHPNWLNITGKNLFFLNSVPDMIIIITIIIIGGGGMINSVPDIIRDTAEATRGGHLDSRGCWLRLNIVTPTTAEIFINIKI